jgi:hypothetical protein
VDDEDADSIADDTATITVTVTDVNEVPVTVLPATPTFAEDSIANAISGIAIEDPEGDNQTVTLTVTDGTVSITTGGVTITTGDGTDDATMVFNGPLSAVNTALGGLTFTPAADFNGTSTLQVQTDDGAGGTDDDTLSITVDPVPDVIAVAVIAPVAGVFYGIGDIIPVTVTFDQVVIVDTGGGAPTIDIVAGSATRQATFASGSNTNHLRFEYTVVAGDSDAGSNIGVTANTLTLNGGTIRDADGDDADLTHAGATGATVDATPPSLSAVDLLAASDTGADSTDNITNAPMPTIEFIAEFGASVQIDWDEGSGFTAASVGTGAAQQETFTAGYLNDDGTKSITVRAIDSAGNIANQTLSIILDTQAPILSTNTGVSTDEGDTVTVDSSVLAATDTVGDDSNLSFTFDNATNGNLSLNGTALLNGDTFTQGDINNDRLTFTHDGSETTSGSFSFTVTDAAGNGLFGQSVAVTVTPVNDPPEANPDTDTTDEATAINRSAASGLIAPNDSDAEGSSLSVTIVDNGTITIPISVGVSTPIAGDQGGLFTISADGAYAFDPNGDFEDLATISRATAVIYTLSDGSSTDTASLTVTVTGINDPPVIGNLDGDSVSLQVGATADIDVGGDATVSNVDAVDYDGGSLIISQTGGAASGDFAVDGTSVTSSGDGTIAAAETISVGGLSIGTVDATNDGQGGNSLQIALNANATNARLQTLLRNIQWSAVVGSGLQTFTVTLNDADGTANGGDEDATANFSMILGNPPVISNLDGDTVTFTEGTAVLLDSASNATIADLDSPASLIGGSLRATVSAGANAAQDILTVSSGATLTSTGAGADVSVGGTVIGTLVNAIAPGSDFQVDFNADATLARVETLIRSLTYNNQSQAPTTGNRTVTVTATDNDGLTSATASVTVLVIAVNDAPTAMGMITPTALNDNAGAQTIFGNIVIGDVDAGENDLGVEIRLSDAAAGTISGGGFTDLGGGVYRLTGQTPTSATTALDSVTFTPLNNTGVSGSFSTEFTIAVDDQTAAEVTHSAGTVTITRINDAPIVANVDSETTAITVGEGVQDVALFNDAAITDPDSADFDAGVLVINQNVGDTNGEWRLDTNVATANGGMNNFLSDNATLEVDANSDTNFTEIGQVDGSNTGIGGTPLRINLNANATPVRVAAFLSALMYDIPSVLGPRTFELTLSDGDGAISTVAGFTLNALPLAPLITSITSASADGLYGVGGNIDVTVTLDTASNFTANGGTLQATLSNGATVTLASVDVSGQTVFSGTYTISEGDGNVIDIDVVSVSLTGGAMLADAVAGVPAYLSQLPLGNNLADNKNINVDATPPNVAVDSLTTNDTTPPLSGTVDVPNATLELTVDGQTVTPTNNGDGTWTLPDNALSALSSGTYNVSVTATDLAGNASGDTSADELTIISDGDGVDDAVENAGPNAGDGNNDGTPDAEQANVTSLPTAVGRGYMTVVVSGACAELQQVAAIDSASLPADQNSGGYPFGLVEFRLPCESAIIEVIYHDAAAGEFADSTYRKYGPVTPGDTATTAWYDFSEFANHSGNVWTLELADDRLGDDTGNDGIIVDQGGPSMPAMPPTAVSVNSPWALLLLVLSSLILAYRYLPSMRRCGSSRPGTQSLRPALPKNS